VTRPQVVLKAGLGASPATGIDLASSDAVGRNLLRSVSCNRGKQRALDMVQPGSLTAELDNQLREFDPFNTAGPFTTGGVTQLRPGFWVQLAAIISGTTYYIWSGFVTSLPINWAVGEAATTSWSASEAMVALARVNPVALTTPVGDSELSGARIARILTNASWPVTTSVFPPFGASRVLDAGVVSVQPTVLGANALAEAQTTALTERGDLFTNGAGQVIYHGRGYRFVQRNGTTNATFGDGGGTEIPWVEGTMTPANDDDLMRNTAHIGAPGLATQTSVVAGTYVSDYSQTGLLLRNEGEALSYANWITATYAGGDPRVDSLTVQPTDNDTNWPTLLGLEQGMWVTVKFRPPGSNNGVVQRECFIESIAHSIPADGDGPWSITFTFGDATVYAGPWFVLNDATYGRLDQGNRFIF
jgi:hypothetical protein